MMAFGQPRGMGRRLKNLSSIFAITLDAGLIGQVFIKRVPKLEAVKKKLPPGWSGVFLCL